MVTKFYTYDKDTAKAIKQMLKDKKVNFQVKEKNDDKVVEDKLVRPLPGLGDGCLQARLPDVKQDVPPIEKKKRGRKKMSKEEKAAKKANRSPEEQQKLNDKMNRLREIRKARKNKK